MTLKNTTIHFFFMTSLSLTTLKNKFEEYGLKSTTKNIDLGFEQHSYYSTVWFSVYNKKRIYEELDTFIRFVALSKELTIDNPDRFQVKYNVKNPVPFDSVDEWKFVQDSIDVFLF